MFELKINNKIGEIELQNSKGDPVSINSAFISALEKTISEVEQKNDLMGIILSSSSKGFTSGWDMNELYALQTATEANEISNKYQKLLRKIELIPVPVIAVIEGNAMDAGMELALACNYRVLSEKARVGFTGVTYGMTPGGGGTLRLPRLIGLEASLRPLLEGTKLTASQALTANWIHETANSPEELRSTARNYIENGGKGTQPWDEERYRIPGGDARKMNNVMLFSATAGILQQKTMGNYPAPFHIMNSIFEGVQIGFDRAMEVEKRYFVNNLLTPQAKNMIRTLYINTPAARMGVARPKNIPPTKVTKLGMLGAGMMGAGIAYSSALSGIEVVLKDVSKESAEKGKAYSKALLQKQVERGRKKEDQAAQILSLIHPSSDPADLKGSELIIEAVFEDRELKARVTQEAEAQIGEKAVFASNTSTLPISGLAEASVRPENFIGLHFFSPVDKMQLVEVIMGKESSDYALAVCLDYVKQIRKIPIVVNDSRSFYTSRVFKTYIVEAFEMVAEGVSPVLIENAGKMAGMAVGPLAVADEVSIELLYRIYKQNAADGVKAPGRGKEVIDYLYEKLNRLGKKDKKGFYEYPEGDKKHLWKGLSQHFPLAGSQPEVEEVKQRLLYIQAIETVKCMEEKVVTQPQDADIGSIFGWGFPPFTGGVISMIDTLGTAEFVRRLQILNKKFGGRFKPTDGLLKMAATNSSYYQK